MRASTVVCLNVGGTRFESSRSTLCRVPGSFFDLLLGGVRASEVGGRRAEAPSSGAISAPAQQSGGAFADYGAFAAPPDGGSFAAPVDGVYFVDRNPTSFPLVLEYLRNGLSDMHVPDQALASADSMSALGREASFFMLPELETFVLRLCLLKRWSGMLPRDLLFGGAERRIDLVNLDTGVGGSGGVGGGGGGSGSSGEALRLVDVELLRVCFPGLAGAVELENARGGDFSGARTSASFVRLPRGDCLRAVLCYARLAGSASESWALPQPAAQSLGFTFVSPQRIEVQRLFDGAEEARLYAVGSLGGPADFGVAAATAAAAGAAAGSAAAAAGFNPLAASS
jgi:hypothetical protein